MASAEDTTTQQPVPAPRSESAAACLGIAETQMRTVVLVRKIEWLNVHSYIRRHSNLMSSSLNIPYMRLHYLVCSRDVEEADPQCFRMPIELWYLWSYRPNRQMALSRLLH